MHSMFFFKFYFSTTSKEPIFKNSHKNALFIISFFFIKSKESCQVQMYEFTKIKNKIIHFTILNSLISTHFCGQHSSSSFTRTVTMYVE